MIYVFFALVGAATFGLCFLIDRLVRRFSHGGVAPQTVRQPTRSAGIGIVLLVAGVALLLFLPGSLGIVGGIVLCFMGSVLAASYFFFSIHYDDEGFTCHGFKGSVYYRYNQIRGEQALATRSGIAVMLYVGDTTVELSEAMKGVRSFLSHAYYARCRQLGLDPAACPPPEPGSLVWFPPPPETSEQTEEQTQTI